MSLAIFTWEEDIHILRPVEEAAVVVVVVEEEEEEEEVVVVAAAVVVRWPCRQPRPLPHRQQQPPLCCIADRLLALVTMPFPPQKILCFWGVFFKFLFSPTL